MRGLVAWAQVVSGMSGHITLMGDKLSGGPFNGSRLGFELQH